MQKMLLEMAERVCIFHKVDNGVDVFRHIGPFPGQVAMSVGRLSVEFWKSIEPYMAIICGRLCSIRTLLLGAMFL